MKKYLSLLIALFLIVSTASAIDYVGVNAGSKRGKFSKTATPVFSTVSATTVNWTTTGTVTANKFTDSTASMTGGNISGVGTITATTANISHGAATFETLTANSLVVVNNADVSGEVSAVTLNASADLVAPTAYLTNILSTLVNTTGVLSEKPLIFGSLCPTAAATDVTANYSIPVTVNGQLYKILLRD